MSASIKNVTCVGSGLIGQGWATLFAARGYEVTLQDVRDDRLENAVRQIHSNLTFLKNNGLVQEDAAASSRPWCRQRARSCPMPIQRISASFPAKRDSPEIGIVK